MAEPSIAYVTEPFALDWDDAERNRIESKFKSLAEEAFSRGAAAECTHQGYVSSTKPVQSYLTIGATVEIGFREAPRSQRILKFPGLSADWYKVEASQTEMRKFTPSTGSKKRAEPGSLTLESVDSVPAPPRPTYVEVSGPNGTIRLSPEVAARNEAAAKDYNRKLKEHAEAVARADAEHAESQARHTASVAQAVAAKQEFEQRVAAAKREYEQRLADHAVKLAATKTAASGGRTSTITGEKDRIFKATSMAFDTKDAAMAYLSILRLPPFFEVQCNQQKFFTPPKWSCTGHYRQTVTRSSTSKQ